MNYRVIFYEEWLPYRIEATLDPADDVDGPVYSNLAAAKKFVLEGLSVAIDDLIGRKRWIRALRASELVLADEKKLG